LSARDLFHTYCPAATPHEWDIFGRALKRWGDECLVMALDRCRRYGDGEVDAYKVARWAKIVADEHAFQPVRERAAQRESAKRTGTPHAALSQAQEQAVLALQALHVPRAEFWVRACGVSEDTDAIVGAALAEWQREGR